MLIQRIKHWFSAPVMSFESAVIRHIGGRDNLEDAAGFRLLEPAGGIWVVTDGVGGQGAGEVAAQIVVDTVLQGTISPTCTPAGLQKLLVVAHLAVQAARLPNSPTADMASTCVLLLCDGRRALWGHVGDSRLYLLRDGQIMYRTEDQSLVNMLVARGALETSDIAQFAQRHVILCALGQDKTPEFCLANPITLRHGDGFLLCSDGIWELLSDEELLDCWRVEDSAQVWLDKIQELITPRVTRNSDNYTALAVKVGHIG